MLNKIKNKFTDIQYIVVIAIFMIFNVFLIKNTLNSKYGVFFVKRKLFIILILILLLVGGLYAVFIKKLFRKVKIEKIFLIITIPIGIAYMLFIPINGTPDEYAHILRAYEISEGSLISKNYDGFVGNELPASVEKVGKNLADVLNLKYSNVIDSLKIKQGKEKSMYEFKTSALYSIFCYVPQSLGILIGKGLKLPVILQLYMGRLFNFIAWVLIIYFCINKSINNKKLILLISLLPICFQSAISLAPDAMTIAVAISIFTFTEVSLYNKKKLLSKKEIALMFILAIFMAMLKIVYLPICLLFLAIPRERFGGKKKKIIILTLLYILTVSMNLIWMYLCFGFIGHPNPGVDAAEQVKFILKCPTCYASIMFDSIVDGFNDNLYSMLGSNLGWLNIIVNKLYLFIYLLIIFFVSLFDTRKKIDKKVEIWFNSLIGFISISVIVLIYTSLYVQWNAVASTTISGVQGRYYLPIFIMIIYLMHLFNPKIKDNIDVNMKYIYIFTIFMNIYVLIVLFVHHI